jgi:hypothetical protein
LPHACWADLNAGDWGLMSSGITRPACPLGSGKFGTPCARTHWAYRSSGPPLAVAPGGRLEDPQAVITAAETTAVEIIVANPASERRPIGAARPLETSTSLLPSSFNSSRQVYGLANNAGGTPTVTPLLHRDRDPPR